MILPETCGSRAPKSYGRSGSLYSFIAFSFQAALQEAVAEALPIAGAVAAGAPIAIRLDAWASGSTASDGSRTTTLRRVHFADTGVTRLSIFVCRSDTRGTNPRYKPRPSPSHPHRPPFPPLTSSP